MGKLTYLTATKTACDTCGMEMIADPYASHTLKETGKIIKQHCQVSRYRLPPQLFSTLKSSTLSSNTLQDCIEIFKDKELKKLSKQLRQISDLKDITQL